MENISEILIGEKKDYRTVNYKDWDGPGKMLSVKIVVPSFCQAKCPFCFNNLTKETSTHGMYMEFFANIRESLQRVCENIGGRPITIDITGNEPTFHVPVFSTLMEIIKEFKPYISQVVLTSNGFHLKECIPYMDGVVNIVNISVHHYDETIRKSEIFQTEHVPSDLELKQICYECSKIGITCTGVAVIFKKFESFDNFYHKFVDYCKSTGFTNVRIRCNFIQRLNNLDEVLSLNVENKSIIDLAALKVIHIADEFDVLILVGVKDTTEHVLGVEVVVDDNGKLYIDYNKRYPLNIDKLQYFANLYLFED